MDTLLTNLKRAYPKLRFEPGPAFSWSPKNNSVVYRETAEDEQVASWSLLHEVSHALLEHQSYESDFELLQMEVEAWARAEELAKTQSIVIDSEHIQDCLDTYRDWLYQRSTCPVCTSCSLQTDSRTYRCFNCAAVWHVSKSRMCRPYRRTHTPPQPTTQQS